MNAHSSEIQQIAAALGERFGLLNAGERGTARMLGNGEIQIFAPHGACLVTVHEGYVSFSGKFAEAARKELLRRDLAGPVPRTNTARAIHVLTARPLPPTALQVALAAWDAAQG